MNENRTSIDWIFWLSYVLFSTLGYGIGGAISLWMIIFGGWPISINFLAIIVLSGSIAGAAVGLIQWQAIRLKSPQVDKSLWMVWNVAGFAIIWMLMHRVMVTLAYSMPLIFSLTLIIGPIWGLLSGTIQWYALRRQIRHPAIWFTLSPLSGIVVMTIGWSSLFILISYNVDSGIGVDKILTLGIYWTLASWFIGGFLYGLISGSLLTRLMRETSQQSGTNKHVLAK